MAAIPLNCSLLCASGAAYDIDPATGKYTPDKIFSKAVAYTSDPTPIAADTINACLVGRTAIGIIVAFRGTLPPSGPGGWSDWLQDLFVEPIPFKGLPGGVHEGFLDAVNSILTPITVAIKALNPGPNIPVYVTGHSKGGAMAPIAAYLLQQGNGIPIKQTVTFAAPKSGDGAFQSGYQSVFKNHIRYENYGDLVPLLPPADGFTGLLARATSFIPEIGPELSKLISEAAGWNYTAVGAELFIESASNHYEISTNELAVEQVFDFGWNLGLNVADWSTVIGHAHTVSCGFGYMGGTCPASVCGG
jgi:Lipase (class 3)